MHPELFKIPLVNYTVHSFGPMVVLGFTFGFLLVRRLSRNITSDPQIIYNVILFCLISGVVGARAFYVVHHLYQFRGNWPSIIATWQGGLEFYGGVIFAVPVIIFYLKHNKLPIRPYLDILAIGLMAGLAFGRIGCFLNGCGFGKPTNLPWAVRFPYNSFAYNSQVNPNFKRNRLEPQLQLPPDYFIYINEIGIGYLKPFEDLSSEQQLEVTKGKFRCLPIHPTQLYSSANAAILCILLFLFWKRALKKTDTKKLFTQAGHTFALAFILYGVTRFILEHFRDDNPFENAWWAIYKEGTISQNIGIYMIITGIVLMVLFQKITPKEAKS